MTLRDCMLYAGIRSSRKFARLTWFERDFFYGLLHAAWPAGRFENDVEVLRAALYAPLLSSVPKRDVQRALVQCHAAGLVKLWTDDGGRGWGEVINYRQHGLAKNRKPKAGDDPPQPGDPPGNRDPDLFTNPGAGSLQKEGMKEGEGARREAPAARPPEMLTQDEWLAGLKTKWSGINLADELTMAANDRRTAGKKLQRDWFEKHWLPKCSPGVEVTGAMKSATQLPEPEGWRVYLKDEYDGEGWAESAAACEWASVPRNWQDKIRREMREARR